MFAGKAGSCIFRFVTSGRLRSGEVFGGKFPLFLYYAAPRASRGKRTLLVGPLVSYPFATWLFALEGSETGVPLAAAIVPNHFRTP